MKTGMSRSMSKMSHQLDLPRFDVESDGCCAAQPNALEGASTEAVASRELELGSAMERDHFVPDLAQIEAAAAALRDALEDFEDAARSKVAAAIDEIARALFPTLADEFLAAEVGRHLPQMLPVAAASVTVRAPPPLDSRLDEIVDQTIEAAGRCKVVSDPSLDALSVEISWETGGLSLNFNALLEACIFQYKQSESSRGV